METHKGLIVNGYEWYYCNKGIHYFRRKIETGYLMIECSCNQLENGDIEFMTEHEITLSQQRKMQIIHDFEKSHNLKSYAV